jgi:membrane-associated protease RseP (regulator of RpoE activity)
MLREIPAGHKVSVEISRDGNVQTLAVELADRRIMEHDVWNKIGSGGDVFAQGSGMGILTGGGDAPLPGGFHMPFFVSTLNVGAMVEPLTSQMAEYLGVTNGLMVKQVAHKSEAATAGLKAFDVILKVGPETIATLADWERALHANQGKPVQVTILRDKKQQTLILQVDSKHKQGELKLEELFGAGDGPMVAELDPEFAQQLTWNDEAAAEALRNQAEALKEQLRSDGFKLDPKQMDQLKQQMEEFRKNFKPEDFKIDQRQVDQLRQQMEEFRKNFNSEEFKIDPKQMDQLRRQMEQFKRQMEEMRELGSGNRV